MIMENTLEEIFNLKREKFIENGLTENFHKFITGYYVKDISESIIRTNDGLDEEKVITMDFDSLVKRAIEIDKKDIEEQDINYTSMIIFCNEDEIKDYFTKGEKSEAYKIIDDKTGCGFILSEKNPEFVETFKDKDTGDIWKRGFYLISDAGDGIDLFAKKELAVKYLNKDFEEDYDEEDDDEDYEEEDDVEGEEIEINEDYNGYENDEKIIYEF